MPETRRFTDPSGQDWSAVELPLQRVEFQDEPLETQRGCLIFECGSEAGLRQRRLGRYPEDWHALSAEQLAELCDEAEERAAGTVHDGEEVRRHIDELST